MQPLLVKDGDFGSVEITEAEIAMVAGHVDLVTHNHPRETSFTADDVLTAQLLGAREVNAFGAITRFRLARTAGALSWPSRAEIVAAIGEIDIELLPLIRSAQLRNGLSPLDAEALHRHVRWIHFAERFSGRVDYQAERRS